LSEEKFGTYERGMDEMETSPCVLTTTATSPAALLDEELVPQFRELGLESAKVIIRGLVLLSWNIHTLMSFRGVGMRKKILDNAAGFGK
jgi:hypothetical protein